MKGRVIALTLVVLSVLSVAIALAQRLPRTLFVENGLGRTLSAVNLESGTVQENILVLGQVPNDLIAYRDKLLVVNSQPPEVLVLDAASRQIQKRIALPEGSNPYQIALVGARRAYVSLLIADQIAVVNLDEGQLEKTIDVGRGPQGIFVDLGASRAYVANTGGYPEFKPATVSIIDIQRDSVVATLPVPENAQSLRAGPDSRIYVVCSGKWGENAGKICILDPWGGPNYEPAIVDTIPVGGFPGDVIVTPEGKVVVADWGDQHNGFLYVYDSYADSLLHYSTNPIRVGKGAMRLLYDPVEDAIFVSNFDEDAIQELDAHTFTVVFQRHVGDGPQALAIVEPIELHDPWADEVVEFVPGDPWSGFGFLFYPYNVLGPPTQSRSVNAYAPETGADEILSLGHGGRITLAFTDNVIVDEPGPDFTVFENCFISLWTGDPFVEAAIVSVSQDGQTWYSFPYDTLTLDGLAGAHPVKEPLNPLDPNVSGGDLFDLADVGVTWARYVRIQDMGDLWIEGPYNGDFDLDAVVAVHSSSEPPSSVDVFGTESLPGSFWLGPVYPNPFNAGTSISFALPRTDEVLLQVLDSRGRVVRTLVAGPQSAGRHTLRWDGKGDDGKISPSGVYLFRLRAGTMVRTEKGLLLR